MIWKSNILMIALLLLISLSSKAQLSEQKLDSIHQQLDQADSDSTRINIWNEWDASLGYSDLEKSIWLKKLIVFLVLI